jgi:hypothetical protein
VAYSRVPLVELHDPTEMVAVAPTVGLAHVATTALLALANVTAELEVVFMVTGTAVGIVEQEMVWLEAIAIRVARNKALNILVKFSTN